MHSIRSLHVHDAAGVGKDIITTAHEMGLRWNQIPIPRYFNWRWPGPLQHVLVRSRRAAWDAELAMRSALVDVVHVHTGGLSPHARWFRNPWVLHLHGTDIRTRQYEAAWKEKIQFGLQNANHIVFSTPDLAEHLQTSSQKSSYLPLTVRLEELPPWRPVRNRVIFASRWDDVKGANEQMEIAESLATQDPSLELVGLDWGERAPEAASAGIRLVPRMNQAEYLLWLASGSAVVGQVTRILSLSELQALAIGVPLISSFDQSFYPELTKLSSNNTVGSHVAAVRKALDEPTRTARLQNGKRYVLDQHNPVAGLKKLIRIYESIL